MERGWGQEKLQMVASVRERETKGTTKKKRASEDNTKY